MSSRSDEMVIGLESQLRLAPCHIASIAWSSSHWGRNLVTCTWRLPTTMSKSTRERYWADRSGMPKSDWQRGLADHHEDI